MDARIAHARLDWLVVTCASRRQAAACTVELAQRAHRGVLPAGCRTIVVPDARDARIGSGAATVLALARVAERLLKGSRARSLRALFEGSRILVVHSGGDSRRLPAYAAEGKLFASVPAWAPKFRCGALFDLLLADLLSLPPRDGGEVLLAAGDAVIGFRAHPVRFDGRGVIGVAQRVPEARARRHGVFARAVRGGVVRAFLQKPTRAELVRAGALGPGNTALADTGLLSFDPESTAALLAGGGVVLDATRRRVGFRAGSVADGAMRATTPPIDLYREVLCAIPAPMRRAAYLASVAPAAREPLGELHDALRGTRFTCVITESHSFLHLGSTAEMLGSLVGPRPTIGRFGAQPGSMPLALRRLRGPGKCIALDSLVERAGVAAGGSIVDRTVASRLELGGSNLLVGVRSRGVVRLPHGVGLVCIPLRRGRRGASAAHAMVAFGLRDDFKTRLDAGGTVLDLPLASLLARAGLPAADLVCGDGTAWDAPLWPELRAGDPLKLLRWLWTTARAPRAWRNAARLSMRQIVARADVAAIARERTAIEAAAVVAATARDLGAIRAPIDRARVAAVLAGAGPASSARVRDLRTAAFHAVGEAVLAQVDVQQTPRRAAVLHDQAVWASAPVRMDLAGGWTDTPPICTEVGGAVVNVALTLRGQLPVQVVAKLEEEPVLRITSTDLGRTCVVRSMRDLARRGDPTYWAALAESALVLTGIAPSDPRASLKRWLQKMGGGVSLTMFSAVPKGSGLGTSSILGAATIKALDRLLGRDRTADALVSATSVLEQMLSTRGGWQDQVGGGFGGFKLATTAPGANQSPAIEAIAVPPRALQELRARSIVYFTGERRMARGILEHVVWNWLAGQASAIDAVHRLRANAAAMHAALSRGDVAAVVSELSTYRVLKATLDPGSSTPAFEALAVRWRRHLAGWCFAGAGGGGFLLLVAYDARHAAQIRADIQRARPHPRARAFDLEIDAGGLRCAVL